MEINFKTRQRVKAFFKEGKPSLVLRLNLPTAEGENEVFVSRFNAFYKALYETYIKTCESYCARASKTERPISFTLEVSQNVGHVSEICVTRLHKLRLPNGEIKRFEALDVFDGESGLLKKSCRKIKTKSKKKEPTEK